jgi:hypothetical protein
MSGCRLTRRTTVGLGDGTRMSPHGYQPLPGRRSLSIWYLSFPDLLMR